ncbi:MAG: GIY-YIG nuclease family protein [Lachnospiraceae bacterium]|nr:GIY-YIG nuclease family protein [Lachnospiraceae bacterium]
MSYTYIIRCENGSLYTGITKDVPRRMAEHYFRTEKGAKYTRARHAVEVMMVWQSDSWSAAATLEHYIKALPRAKKLTLISSPDILKQSSPEKLKGNLYIPVSDYNGLIRNLLPSS